MSQSPPSGCDGLDSERRPVSGEPLDCAVEALFFDEPLPHAAVDAAPSKPRANAHLRGPVLHMCVDAATHSPGQFASDRPLIYLDRLCTARSAHRMVWRRVVAEVRRRGGQFVRIRRPSLLARQLRISLGMSKRKRSEDVSGVPPQEVGSTTASSDERDRIARRAYELYMERGCGEGQDMDDWCRAEREIRNGGGSRVES